MGEKTTMLHVHVPTEIVRELDALLQKYPEIAPNRTQFIVSTLKDRLHREQMLRALQSSKGAFSDSKDVAWAGTDAVDWVREQRARVWPAEERDS